MCHLTFSRVAESSRATEHTFQPGSFTLKAPISDPQKLICIGMNYVDHCTEQNIPVPEEPVIFSKFPSAITDPNGPVLYPEETTVSDYCIYIHVHVYNSIPTCMYIPNEDTSHMHSKGSAFYTLNVHEQSHAHVGQTFCNESTLFSCILSYRVWTTRWKWPLSFQNVERISRYIHVSKCRFIQYGWTTF